MIFQTLNVIIYEILQRGLTQNDLTMAIKFFEAIRALPIGLQASWLFGIVIVFLLNKDYATAWEAQRLGITAQVKPLRVLLRGFAVGFSMAFIVATLSIEAGMGGLLVFLIMSRRYNWAVFYIAFLLILNSFSYFVAKNESNKSWFSI